MTDARAPTFLVAAEDRAGFEAVTILVDRLLEEEVSWMRGVLEHSRVWAQASRERPWISITAAKREAAGARRRIRGHFGGEPARPTRPTRGGSSSMSWIDAEPPRSTCW